MNICFMCDLHLSYNKKSAQYDVLNWACEDIKKKKTDVVVFAGDFTADGNVFAAKRFIKKIKALEIPVVMIPGNSDCRTEKNIPLMRSYASACVNHFGNIKILAVNDCEKTVSEEEFRQLEMADSNTIVFMHHPIHALTEPSRSSFTAWRNAHPEVQLFYGHLHKSFSVGNSHSLQAMDPDKAIGENPCITYYNTETKELRKAYYFCPVPGDFYDYIGISCFDPIQDTDYAAEHKLKCIELRPNVLESDSKEIKKHISNWRRSGGENLSMHAPEIVYENGKVTTADKWDKFIDLASYLNTDRITVHVPKVSVEVIRKDRNALDVIADFLAKRFAILPEKCVVGIENMHMTSADKPDSTRRFGYVPEECIEFMKHLQKKCTRHIGINLDTGHARNNAPFSRKYPVGTWYAETGKYTVGYHIHQVIQTPLGFENHKPLTELYGSLISYASFFDSWSKGKVNKAPVIFEIRGHGDYKPTIELFEIYKNRNVFDLHSHTLFSNCGRDKPEKLVSTAIANGITLLGISDHSYGIGDRKQTYLKKIRELSEKYADRIKILCGIEIPTFPHLFDIQNPDEIAEYDYCLIEHITDDSSVAGSELFEFCKKMGIRCGIAHTDMFAYCRKYGYEPSEFFKKMAEHGIFWEMNVSYDSIHSYREHSYVKEFMKDKEQQRIVKEAGLYISVGFDSHRREDYDGFKVHQMYDWLVENGFNTADRLFV